MFNRMGFSFYKRVSFVKETMMVENSKGLHCKRKSKFVLSQITKKAQVGNTATWMVATVAIVIILLFSIFLSTSYFSDQKRVASDNQFNQPAVSSFFSYALTENSQGERVYDKIKQEEDLNEFNGNLALDIFYEFYSDLYNGVWLGVNFEGFGVRKNDYFGTRPTTIRGGDVNKKNVPHLSEELNLTSTKFLELALAPK